MLKDQGISLNSFNDITKAFHKLLNKIDNYIFVTDDKERILHVNEPALEVLGVNESELKGKFIPIYSRESKRINLRELIAFKEEFVKGYLHIKDGKKLSVKIHIMEEILDGHEIYFYIIKDEEEEVVVQERFLKIFKNTSSLVAISQVDTGVYLDVNDSFFNTLGYKREELIGKSSLQLNMFANPEIRNKIIERLKKEQYIKGHEIEILDKNGQHHVGLFSMSFIESSNQKHLLTIMEDVTEYKKIQRALKESEEKVKLALSGSGMGAWYWNIKERTVEIDEKWLGILGYTLEELSPLTTEKWCSLMHQEDVLKSTNLLLRHFQRIDDYYECEIRMRHKDGHIVWVFDRGKVIERDYNDKPIRMTGIHMDITKLKQAENIQNILVNKEKQEIAKNEFLANISHELRTPINVIFSVIQLESRYLDSLDKTKIIKYNDTIRQNCLRLIRLINNIIDLTRIEAGFFDPIFHIENIVTIIENTTLSIKSYAEMKNISILFDTEEEEIYVNCDSCLIERIILNLLSNSVKYGVEGGLIEVILSKEKGNLVLKVRDNGIGIPKEMQEKVFERFQRVDNGTTRSNEGSGIGLSIVKSLVEIQGGKITIESGEDFGTEFCIKFPIVQDKVSNSEEKYHNKFKLMGENNMARKAEIEFSDIY